MKYYFLTVSLFIHLVSFSQNYEKNFGEISREEIEMTSYEKDSSAGAVVLFDIGKSKFISTDYGYKIRFTRHKRTKIFKRSAFEHAEVSIPFYVDGYGKTESVESIKAVTYNLNNGQYTRTKLDPFTIYEEKINDRWHNKKFVFPNVQEGSILEFEYVLETPFLFNLLDWKFQDRIPTIYSEYEVRMIPFYEYIFLAQGLTEFDYQNSTLDKEKRTWGNVVKSKGVNVGSGIEFQDYIHTYVKRDIPAFKDESYITSVNDYIMKMDFQLAKFNRPNGGSEDIISTWPKLNESLLKEDNFGKYQKKCSKLAKRLLKENVVSLSGSINQIAIDIIRYVKENFTWNGSNSKYSSQSAKDFFEKKRGNSADINLFLIAFLNEAGINSKPVIISTRNHGKIRTDYPFDHFTNYVIALVDTDQPFLTDGTEEMLPYNRLPTQCINEIGLIVTDDKSEKWVRLDQGIPSLRQSIISINFDSTAFDPEVNVSIQNTGYDAYVYRKRFKDDEKSIMNYFSEKVGEIHRIKTINYDNPKLPYSIAFEGTCKTEQFGRNIVINPFLNLTLSSNGLTQEKRNYPVDMIYPGNEIFSISLKLPEGFKVYEIPESFTMNNDLAEIKINYTLRKGSLYIKGNYNLKKAVYNPNEYNRIKNYLDLIVKKFNETLVLEET